MDHGHEMGDRFDAELAGLRTRFEAFGEDWVRDDEIKFDVLLTFILLGIPNGSWPLLHMGAESFRELIYGYSRIYVVARQIPLRLVLSFIRSNGTKHPVDACRTFYQLVWCRCHSAPCLTQNSSSRRAFHMLLQRPPSKYRMDGLFSSFRLQEKSASTRGSTRKVTC